MDKKKIIAILVFIFFSFYMFTYADTGDSIYEDKTGNTEEVKTNDDTTTNKVVTKLKNNKNNNTQTTMPTITLGDNVYEMNVFDNIPLFNASASGSNVTLTITNDINKDVVGTYTVTFTATDEDGNTTVVTKEFKVVDTEKPVITLNGNKEVIIRKGDIYKDEGATAWDNYDKDLTSSIVTNSNVNATTAGDYKVTYNVTDNSGNKANEVLRTVTVVDADKLSNAISEGDKIKDIYPFVDNITNEELKDLLKDLDKSLDDGKDIYDNSGSTQKEVDDSTKTIEDIIDAIKNLKFNVTFKYYSGIESVSETQKVLYDHDAIAPTNTERTGYTFTKWDKPYTNILDDLIVNALYEAKNDTVYTVNVYKENLNGEYDKSSTTKTGTTDTTVTLDKEELEGFTIDNKSNFKTVVVADGTGSINIYYNRNSYKLTVDGVSSNYKYGETITISNPSKDGYEFNGWSETIPSVMPAHDISITSSWNAIEYNISYVLNGGVNNENNPSTYTIEDEITLSPATKVGYDFVGWKLNDTTITKIEQGTTGNISLEAIFEASDNTIYKVNTYKENLNGEYELDSVSQKTGTTGTQVSVTPSALIGFEVDDKSNLSTTINADGTSEINVYYKRKTYVVTFMVDNTTYKTQNVKYEGNVNFAITNPTKDSSNTLVYTFVGWNTDASATTVIDSLEITSDTTLYAIFSESTRYYTVTFNYYVNGVEKQLVVDSIQYNQTVSSMPTTDQLLTTTYDNGTHTYRRFTGWTNDFSTSTNVTSDLVINALYGEVSSDATNVYRLKSESRDLSQSKINEIKSTGGSFSSSYYEKVNVGTLSFVDFDGEIAATIAKATKASNGEAILALGQDNIFKYLTDEAKTKLNNLNTGNCTYDWYVLKYNTGDGWHLDGERSC